MSKFRITQRFHAVIMCTAIILFLVACSSAQPVELHTVSHSEYARDGKLCILYRVYTDVSKDELTEDVLIASYRTFIKKNNDNYYLHDIMVYSSSDMADGTNSFDIAEIEELSKGATPVVRFAK